MFRYQIFSQRALKVCAWRLLYDYRERRTLRERLTDVKMWRYVWNCFQTRREMLISVAITVKTHLIETMTGAWREIVQIFQFWLSILIDGVRSQIIVHTFNTLCRSVIAVD
ncbi:hypothetical protein [Roseiflexus sp.]